MYAISRLGLSGRNDKRNTVKQISQNTLRAPNVETFCSMGLISSGQRERSPSPRVPIYESGRPFREFFRGSADGADCKFVFPSIRRRYLS